MPRHNHTASPGQEWYAPLCRFLAALDPDARAVQLSLDHIAHLVGVPLPPDTHRRFYWSTGIVAKHNWRRTGFRGALDPATNAVTFTRITIAGSHQAPRAR